MKRYIVTAAVLVNSNEVLCMKRGKGKYDYISYKYEFPGGKVEENETLEYALSRELREEMSIDIEITKDQFFVTVEHQYPDFEIVMHAYVCSVDFREFTMHEHIDFKWLPLEEISMLDWAPADIPIVNKLLLEGIYGFGVKA